jgi:predicted transcriptional regulator with HTH domain
VVYVALQVLLCQVLTAIAHPFKSNADDKIIIILYILYPNYSYAAEVTHKIPNPAA